jgi:hypothetical protein
MQETVSNKKKRSYERKNERSAEQQHEQRHAKNAARPKQTFVAGKWVR